MSLLTKNLKLFKWDLTNATDLASLFNIEKSLNENWDKIDELVEQIGCQLQLSIDENYVMKLSLLNKNEEEISSAEIDFPIESMVVNATYKEGNLTLTLQNGNELTVDISAIVGGLVSETTLREELKKKVDKEEGKGLSSNDFTDELLEKLNSLNNYDDTQMKKDIEEIKTEQTTQNENIDSIKEEQIVQNDEIKELKKENEILEKVLPKGQATGEDITLPDSADANFKEFKTSGNTWQETREEQTGTTVEGETILASDVEIQGNKFSIQGNSWQETRSGKNILNIKDVYDVGSNTSINEDDFITTTVDNNEGVATKFENCYTNPSKLIRPSTTYYIVCEIQKVSGTGALNLVSEYTDNDSQFSANKNYSFTDLKAGDIKILSSQSKEDLTESSIQSMLRTYCTFLVGQSGSITYRISVLEQQTTEKDFVYEPYGVMPSIEFPSKVESCGDNVNIFDKDNVNVLQDMFINTTLKKLEGLAGRKCFYLKVDNNSYYTVSKKVRPKAFFIATTEQVPQLDSPTIQNIFDIIEKEEVTIHTTQNENYLVVYYFKEDETLSEEDILSNIKIEKGTKATPWSLYNQGNINIKLENGNIAKINENAWELTENNTIKNKARNQGIELTTVSIKKGQTIHVYFKLITKPTMTTSFTGRLSDDTKDNTALSIGPFHNYEVGKLYTRTLTATQDDEFTYKMWGNENNDTFEFQLWASTEELTDYILHKEQTYSIPTQEPFRKIEDCKDTFVEKVDGWYEKHNFLKYILDGTQIFNHADTDIGGVTQMRVRVGIDNLGIKESSSIMCDRLTAYPGGQSLYSEQYVNGASVVFDTNAQKNNLQIKTDYTLYAEETDNSDTKINKLKEFLKENNVAFYMQLKTPKLIKCTEEQSKILDEIKNMQMYMPTTRIYSEDKVSPISKLQYNYVPAMPSIETSSEMKDCGDNINWLNAELINKSSAAGVNITQKDGLITYDGTVSTSGSTVLIPLTLEEEDYVCSMSGKHQRPHFTFRDENEGYLQELLGNIKVEKAGKYYAGLNLGNSGFTFNSEDTAFKLKLEKDTKVATPWSPYNQGNINIDILNKNVFIFDEDIEQTINGITFKAKKGSSKIKMIGTATASFTLPLHNYINMRQFNSAVFNKKVAMQISNFKTNNDKRTEFNIGVDGNNYFAQLNNVNTYIIKDINKEILKLDLYVQSDAVLDTECEIQFEINDTKTDIVNAELQTYAISTQEPFRGAANHRDTFIEQDDGWYEKHLISKFNLKDLGKWEKWQIDDENYCRYRVKFTHGKDSVLFCNKLKVVPVSQWKLAEEKIEADDSYLNITLRAERFKEASSEEINEFIANSNILIYAITSEPKLIKCTEEQSRALNEIKESAKTYKHITHITSTDEIKPYLDVTYYKDIETILNSLNTVNSASNLQANTMPNKQYMEDTPQIKDKPLEEVMPKIEENTKDAETNTEEESEVE